eukprot:scaffold54221_cov55-Phaeocystis_antarctica.AAC.6
MPPPSLPAATARHRQLAHLLLRQRAICLAQVPPLRRPLTIPFALATSLGLAGLALKRQARLDRGGKRPHAARGGDRHDGQGRRQPLII